jgi:hypothetical protein
MPRRPRRLATLLTALLLLGPVPGARAATGEHLARLKRLQQQLLLSEPAEKLEKLERAEQLRKKPAARGGRSRAGQRRRKERPDDLARTPAPRGRAATPGGLAGPAAPPNYPVSDPTGEPGGAAQSEVSIAALGNRMVATYNDGIGFYGPPWPEDTQGYSYSSDGGLTWADGGAVPNGGRFVWASDPVVVVNEKTGDFYYCALIDIPGGMNGIAAIKGAFCGDTFAWGDPVVAIQASNLSALLDKQWMAVDSLTGNLHITYSHFVVSGGVITSNSIRSIRSTDDNGTWSAPLTLSAPGDAGMVQGSRPAVGPDGEVYATWHAIGQISGPNANSPYGRDFLRVRKSTDGGASFAAQVTADSVFSNFATGAPGFNRGIGITFPGIAVDRTAGPNRGRVYLTWNESLNFYNDPPPTPGVNTSRSEVENNNGPTAPNVITFFPGSGNGEILRGTISTTGNPGDLDYWKWDAVQGQTVIFYLDSLDMNLDASFRLFCSDGVTNIGFSQNGTGGQALLVFTVPTTGTYYARVASYTGTRTGRYRVLAYQNTPQADRGRDHRDLFVKSSANGAAWGPTVRVNDSPPYFDDWFPEVQVDGLGRLFVAAYDWRDSPSLCGGGSGVYLYRSDVAGASWLAGAPMSEAITNWTATSSTLIPNQGDYIGLFARDTTALVAWGDGRRGDPDIFMAASAPAVTCVSAPVCLVDTTAGAQQITLTWSAPPGLSATLLRRVGSGPFASLGTVTADASGRIVYVDSDVTAGQTHTYTLEVQGFCERWAGLTSVTPFCTQAPVSVAGTQAEADRVTVTWAAPSGLTATVQRRTGAGAFADLAQVVADASDRIVFEDTTVAAATTYTYRLAVQGFCQATTGEVTVSTPGAAFTVSPNPTAHDVWVTFVVPAGTPVTLELLDVTGRQVKRMDAAALGPGTHRLNLTAGLTLKPGLYFVRLVEGGRTSLKRVSIFP